jgi:hypothetical protein
MSRLIGAYLFGELGATPLRDEPLLEPLQVERELAPDELPVRARCDDSELVSRHLFLSKRRLRPRDRPRSADSEPRCHIDQSLPLPSISAFSRVDSSCTPSHFDGEGLTLA